MENVQVDQNRRESSGPILLSELTSPGFAAAMQKVEAVLIPVGAHEQHGPALPVSTDTLSAQVLSALTATLMAPRVAVAPAIPWGVSWHHMGFPGTIALREGTLAALVVDMVTSLHAHGVERFVLINIHGGNNAALQMAVEQCHREHGVPLVASVFAYTLIANAAADRIGPEAVGHGGGDESSVILATRPELVVQNSLGPRSLHEQVRQSQALVRSVGGVLPTYQHVTSGSGATGDSTHATSEVGAEILGEAASRLQAILENLLEIDLDLLRAETN